MLLIKSCHQCGEGLQIKVYVQAFGFSVGRDFYRATHDVTKAVGFALSYKRPPDTLLLLQQVVGTEYLFLTGYFILGCYMQMSNLMWKSSKLKDQQIYRTTDRRRTMEDH